VVNRRVRPTLLVLALSFAPIAATHAETGYELWLRYRLVVNAERLREYRQSLGAVAVDGRSPTFDVVREELLRALSTLLGWDLVISNEMTPKATLLVGTYDSSATVRSLIRRDELSGVGAEGFVIRRPFLAGRRVTVVAANSDNLWRRLCVALSRPDLLEEPRFATYTLRIENAFEATTSRWRARWFRVAFPAPAPSDAGEFLGETDIRLYSAHELAAMLRPERWSRVDLYGGLDGTPFSFDAPRLVLVARK